MAVFENFLVNTKLIPVFGYCDPNTQDAAVVCEKRKKTRDARRVSSGF